MTSKLEKKILISFGVAFVFFFLSTVHLFQHISSPEYVDKHPFIKTSVDVIVDSPINTILHLHKSTSVGQIFFSTEEANSLMKKIPFPQSIKNEEMEKISHPAVDMMQYLKKNKNKEEGGADVENPKKNESLFVPEFWSPPSLFKDGVREFLGNYGERLITPEEAKTIGSYITPVEKESDDEERVKNDNGSETGLLETIFVSIASYRDYRCPHTLKQLFIQAKYPERVRVAIVDQLDLETDTNCAKPERSCVEYPDDTLCKYSHLIDLYEMDATMAVGPVLARHIGNRLYRGEYFAMQSDSHMEFIKSWDVEIIKQWYLAKNEMAVLSTYVSDVNSHYNATSGLATTKTRPKMCNTDFDVDYYDNRLANLMHGQQPEGLPDVHDEPTLLPFWAAGFSFARGHFMIQVPYDRYLPMIFQGEEINIGLRGFTYGYDYYAPEHSIIFHYYSNGGKDKKVKTFWEHSNSYSGLEQASMARLLGITKLLPTTEGMKEEAKRNIGKVIAGNGVEPKIEEKEESEVLEEEEIEWNGVEEKEYGLGKVRTLEKFLRTFGINIYTQKIQHHLCRFVGKPMNDMFLANLREDGMGINYDKIVFEFLDPEEHGKQWEGPDAEDPEWGDEEEEEVAEEESGEEEEESGEEEAESEEEEAESGDL
jgi:[Skp1-protein]-hydroxyproline N-acetylglucosaminyltransferase